MTTNPYPNLGFNPTPGDAAQVATLSTKVKAAADAVTETNALLNRLRNNNDDVWKGDAGQAFRDNYDATLSQDLDRAQSALQGASTLITTWHADLIGFQDTAKSLETEAAAARAEHATAVTALQQAKTNPDLGLANQTFTDSAQLAAAQSRLDAASTKLSTAATAVNNCQSAIDAIIARATSLQTNHTAKARTIATELDAAANFSPSEPDKSIWDEFLDWIDRNRDDIHTVLSTTAAVGGLLAIITPPPFSGVALGISLAAGAGALALDATDDELRDDLLHGSATEKAGAAGRIAGDALSVLPGVGGVLKAGKALTLGGGADDVGRFTQTWNAWNDGAADPGLVARAFTDRNVFGVTDKLASSGATTGVHSLLELTTAVGKDAAEASPARALAVMQRFTGSSYKGIDLSNNELDFS
ncbi:hypothetical protein ACFWUP_06740 [Nocardia sp. NPDC058658]|uniref:hypothetical protein n=1 Tax=Nocardia sp. NPDC058658 TaxID=3346580 RepID=UPI003660812B